MPEREKKKKIRIKDQVLFVLNKLIKFDKKIGKF